ncbi:peptide-N-glycosidase F-related protein [Nannocystaceae bacterium ST9]
MPGTAVSNQRKLLVLSNLSLVLSLMGCTGGPSDSDSKADDEIGSESGGSGTDSTGGDTTSTTDTTTETGDGDGDVECFDGVAPLPFDASASEVGYDLPAPDFAIDELRGPQTLAEFWTGCENHVFVIYAGNWWGTPIDPLVDDSDPDTHYWFIDAAQGHDLDMRTAIVGQIAQKVEARLEALGPEVHAARTSQFHYVLTPGLDIPLVTGILAANPNEAHFTVDRHQLVREGHNVAVFAGSWTPLLQQTRYWAKYFNAQYALDAALADEEASGDVLVERVADGVEIKGGEPFTWTLPDAATIAEYDRLAIDLRVGCPGAGHPYVATCGEWDTIASIWLCSTPDCSEPDKRRIVKWITPYSSPGRWLIDITPELLALAEGGELTFVSAHGDNDVGQYTYRYTADLRFSKSEDGLRPIASDPLVVDGNYGWDANYHMMWNEFVVTPPPGTERVELVAKISGHGGAEGSNCAEFCSFTHEFTIGGTAFGHQYLMENADRCAESVALGVTPNQGGTWFYDRSSWCPGWVIEEWSADVSAAIDLGGETSISYASWFGNQQPPTGGGATMDAKVELVYYGAP